MANVDIITLLTISVINEESSHENRLNMPQL